MAVPGDLISFSADLVGVLLGAFLGYLLGLRQQRIIDSERVDRTRKELKEALKSELDYVVEEVGGGSEAAAKKAATEPFNPLAFVVFLDMPTYTSIVDSGQLLLLDSGVVQSLRELNAEVHAHNIAQTVFAGVGGSLGAEALASRAEEFNRILLDPGQKTTDRLAGLVRIVVLKRQAIAQKAGELSQRLKES